jgi:hypothetical protein
MIAKSTQSRPLHVPSPESEKLLNLPKIVPPSACLKSYNRESLRLSQMSSEVQTQRSKHRGPNTEVQTQCRKSPRTYRKNGNDPHCFALFVLLLSTELLSNTVLVTFVSKSREGLSMCLVLVQNHDFGSSMLFRSSRESNALQIPAM